MEKKPVTLLALVASTLLCASAFAVERGRSETDTLPEARPAGRAELAPSVGLMAGLASQNDETVDGGTSWLLDVGFQPYIPFSVGAQFQRTAGNIEIPGANPDFNTTNYLLRGAYNFGGDIPVLMHSYAGAKAGLTQYSGDVEESTHFSFGPMLGFDIPIDQAGFFTLGAEGAYLAVLGDPSPDQVSLLGAAKYWF